MNETREQLKEEIRARATDWLQRDKSGKGFICPICGSGSGKDGTGITTKDGVHFTCWAKGNNKCPDRADVIDIIGTYYGLTDYNDKLQKAAEEVLRYTGNVRDLPNGTRGVTDEEIKQYFEKQKKAAAPEPEPETDCTEFFRECAARINETKYHREISAETLHRFQVGYCPDWINPKAIKTCRESGKPLPPATPRLIIPTSKYSYLARDTRENLTDKEKQFNKVKFGKMHIFNLTALDGQEPVYIVEGEIDALSIIDAGAAAIGLGSTSMVKSLIEYLKTHKPAAPLILSLDNDKRGAQAQGQLVKGLKEQKIPFICFKVSGEYKDPNEYLMKDREGFTATVSAGIKWVTETPQERYQRQYSAAAQVQGIIDKIAAGIGINAYTPTGFQQLDNILDGGLFPGLYIIGALSSLGKTTFTLQIADQIAASGRDVLFFSMEMATEELIAKSVSRISYYLSNGKGKGKTLAKTTRGIMTSERWAHYRVEEEQHLMAAFEEYRATIGQHLYIIQGMGDYTAEKIRHRVEEHIEKTGTKPVVFIDYLQILAPLDAKSTDKQNTDQAVLELKRMSRDNNIPVFAISSFNRENYYLPVSMTSFKESGAIEYSSDVLIGLQPKGWDYQDGEKPPARSTRLGRISRDNEKAAKSGNAIFLEVKILKNRNGGKGVVTTAFTPCFNHYEEMEQEPGENAADTEAQERDRIVFSSTKRP